MSLKSAGGDTAGVVSLLSLQTTFFANILLKTLYIDRGLAKMVQVGSDNEQLLHE